MWSSNMINLKKSIPCCAQNLITLSLNYFLQFVLQYIMVVQFYQSFSNSKEENRGVAWLPKADKDDSYMPTAAEIETCTLQNFEKRIDVSSRCHHVVYLRQTLLIFSPKTFLRYAFQKAGRLNMLSFLCPLLTEHTRSAQGSRSINQRHMSIFIFSPKLPPYPSQAPIIKHVEDINSGL